MKICYGAGICGVNVVDMVSIVVSVMMRTTQVDEMREAFLEFDIDGDGTITTKVLKYVTTITIIINTSIITSELCEF